MIKRFLNHLIAIKGYSENTARAYGEDLRAFVHYAKEVDPRITWSKITKGFVESYVYTMHEMELNNSTICRRISSLRSFYKFCISEGMTKTNPAQYVSSPKKAKTLPHVIETGAIIEAIGDKSASLEARGLICLAYETGMRLQEMLNLQYTDTEIENRTITVRGKGNKERIVFHGEKSVQLIDMLHGKNGNQLFGELEQREARKLVYDVLRKYSHARQLSPHAIRHTYATEMLNNGASIKAVSELLGHESVKTTEIYAHLSQPTLFDTYVKTAPRA